MYFSRIYIYIYTYIYVSMCIHMFLGSTLTTHDSAFCALPTPLNNNTGLVFVQGGLIYVRF